MDKPITNPPAHTQGKPKGQMAYVRFTLSQRIEHILFLASFTMLAFTGLPQKYANTALGQTMLNAFGGIETTRQIHHFSAFVMMLVTIYHVMALLYKIFVLRTRWTMVPVVEDIQHLFQDIQYYLGMRTHKAYYGRYNYAEKLEYLAVVWGTIVMGLTGFMMWNPIAATRFLPGQLIPASKAAHGAEAVLAVLAILIWHFYYVHLRSFNKSMFTGKITREEMEHEHPAELSQIDSGEANKPIPLKELRRRQRLFFPPAILLAAAMSFGVYAFVTMETTAISTLPKGETAQIYVPITPTPRPTPAPTPTLQPGQEVGADTWEGYYSGLFRNRCSTCHGITKVSGLSLETYQDALKGGDRGPAIIPGDPDNSMLVQVQGAGSHPGQLTIDELNRVIAWIKAGAPER